MQILYIGYWSAFDGLSQSTIHPNLKQLAERDHVERVHYVSIERKAGRAAHLDIHRKVQHHPVQSLRGLPHLLTKWSDFRRVKRKIRQIGRAHKLGLVISRTSLAGYFGIYARTRFALPLVVESFEPHGDYMVDSGAWRRGGIKHRFETELEKKILTHAMIVSPVSLNHRQHLIASGANPARVFAVPCYVFPDIFRYDEAARQRVRNQLRIPDKTVLGIYTGKFGDIYYDAEAFRLFTEASSFFHDFFLVILSPQPVESIQQGLSRAGYPIDRCHIAFVKHEEVSNYLSAADFAFSTIRPTPSRRFCSPVKDGEYWAAGLPILIPDGVGDDSDIVKKERAGAIVEIDDPAPSLGQIQELMREPGIKERMHAVALKHRNFERQVEVYDRVFAMIGQVPRA